MLIAQVIGTLNKFLLTFHVYDVLTLRMLFILRGGTSSEFKL